MAQGHNSHIPNSCIEKIQLYSKDVLPIYLLPMMMIIWIDSNQIKTGTYLTTALTVEIRMPREVSKDIWNNKSLRNHKKMLKHYKNDIFGALKGRLEA